MGGSCVDRKNTVGAGETDPHSASHQHNMRKNSVPQQVKGDGALRPPMSDIANVRGESVGALGSSYE